MNSKIFGEPLAGMKRAFVVSALIAALAACQSSPPPGGASGDGAKPASRGAGAAGGPQSAGGKPPPATAQPDYPPVDSIPGANGKPQAPFPFPTVQSGPSAPPAPAAAPVSPANSQSAQRMVPHIIELLETGREDAASAEIQQLLALDPGNRVGQNLQRQITADPVATLGSDSFPYTVKPGDSMSAIARRFLGDGLSFYMLSRYNDIRVPRQLAVGQTIKIPGRTGSAGSEPVAAEPAPAPPPVAVTPSPVPPSPPQSPPPSASVATAPPPVPAAPTIAETQVDRWIRIGTQAQNAGDSEKAYTAFKQAVQLDPNNADAKAKMEQSRQDLVGKYTFTARTAFAKQDLDGAIKSWDSVVSLDPANETAKLERQKAIALREKLKTIQ